MAEMSVAERGAILARALIGVLATPDAAGAPLAIPIRYGRDGAGTHVHLRHLAESGAGARDGRVRLTVAESAGVPEARVAIEGVATIEEGTGFALAHRLAPRY